MIIIVLLIFISLSIAIGFLFVFLWNVKSGQYDDMYTPSVRMLFDEKIPDSIKESEKKESKI
jgi:cbb3-type cytochrome oxidase maturation protein